MSHVPSLTVVSHRAARWKKRLSHCGTTVVAAVRVKTDQRHDANHKKQINAREKHHKRRNGKYITHLPVTSCGSTFHNYGAPLPTRKTERLVIGCFSISLCRCASAISFVSCSQSSSGASCTYCTRSHATHAHAVHAHTLELLWVAITRCPADVCRVKVSFRCGARDMSVTKKALARGTVPVLM